MGVIAVGAPSRSDRIHAVINVTERRFQEIFHGKVQSDIDVS